MKESIGEAPEVIRRSAGVKMAANGESILVGVRCRGVNALVGVSEAVMLDIVA